MSLVDFASEYAFENTVEVYVNANPLVAQSSEEMVDNFLDHNGAIWDTSHGHCCGLSRNHILVNFDRKDSYSGSPADMRRRTVIATTTSEYAGWIACGGGGFYGPNAEDVPPTFIKNPINAWRASVVKKIMNGEWSIPNLFSLVYDSSMLADKPPEGRFRLPTGPMLTPSGSYCAVPRTLPRESVGTIEVRVYMGALPHHVGKYTFSHNFPKHYIQFNSGTPSEAENNLKGIHHPKPDVDFDIDNVVGALKGLILS